VGTGRKVSRVKKKDERAGRAREKTGPGVPKSSTRRKKKIDGVPIPVVSKLNWIKGIKEGSSMC